MGLSYEMTGQLADVARIRSSYSGNPRFRVVLVTGEEGAHLYRTLNTASDASFNYEVGNKGLRAGDHVVVTMSGRGTVADMRPDEDATVAATRI